MNLGYRYFDGHPVCYWTFVGDQWGSRRTIESRIDATWWLGSDVLEVLGHLGGDRFEMILPTAF